MPALARTCGRQAHKQCVGCTRQCGQRSAREPRATKRLDTARQALCAQAGDGMWGWISHGRRNGDWARDSNTSPAPLAGQNQ